MSRLLREIKHYKSEAAEVLEDAGLRTDSDIQTLTREDLHELFPGCKNLKLRKTIFDIIHKQKPVHELLKQLFPGESLRAADNSDRDVYLNILKDMKTQMNNVLDAHIRNVEESSTNQPNQESAINGPKGAPGKNIPLIDLKESHSGQTVGGPQRPPGANTFFSDEPMDCNYDQTDRGPQGEPDSWIASGERDLYTDPTSGHPQGPQSKNIAPIDLKESHSGQTVGGPQGAPGTGTSDSNGEFGFSSLQTGGHPQGPRSTSTATAESMMSLNDQTCGRPQRASDSLPATGASGASSQMALRTGQTGGHPKGPQTKLKYRMVVSGKTFDAHLSLMKKVMDQLQNQVQFIESDQDHQITFLFCPISSRVASDVEAAMADASVSSDVKPIILVLMHHTREVKSTSSVRTWRDDNKVVLFVHVFYHETIHGLLKCDQNNAAVSEIVKELLERFLPGNKDMSGNTQDVGAKKSWWPLNLGFQNS